MLWKNPSPFSRVFQSPLALLRLRSLLGTFCRFQIRYQERLFQHLYGFLYDLRGSASILTGVEPSPLTKLEDYTIPPPWVPFPTTVAFRYFDIARIASCGSDDASGVSVRTGWVVVSRTAISSP
ncbi:unnamed protein product [Sphenostylis stenocarpa]|uniref:Uncharacterized protein n=1 Tax=Sphenostylis stenocarpa TaxID=92480 RepID=A0AA86SHM3_9FABA|nr:unnamed protein product [Sphenostylis stenocarpa]